MSPEEIETIARYLSDEVVGDFVFDNDDHGTGPEYYRTHAAALLRTVRSLGWREPERIVGPVCGPQLDPIAARMRRRPRPPEES